MRRQSQPSFDPPDERPEGRLGSLPGVDEHQWPVGSAHHRKRVHRPGLEEHPEALRGSDGQRRGSQEEQGEERQAERLQQMTPGQLQPQERPEPLEREEALGAEQRAVCNIDDLVPECKRDCIVPDLVEGKR